MASAGEIAAYDLTFSPENPVLDIPENSFYGTIGSLHAESSSGGAVSYSYDDPLGNFEVGSDGTIQTLVSAQAGDSFTFTGYAWADYDAASTQVTVNVVASTNRPPQIVGGPYDLYVPVNELYGVIGNVYAEDPEGDSVYYSGYDPSEEFAVDEFGYVYANTSANVGDVFSFTAYAHDYYGGADSTTVTVHVIDSTDQPPDIVSFGYEYLGYGTYLVVGAVEDEDPGSCIVTFGGLLDGAWTEVDSDGSFSYPMQMSESSAGMVTAVAIDTSGQNSDEAWFYKSPH